MRNSRYLKVLACLLGLAGTASGNAQETDWAATIHRVSDGVVTLMADHPRSFDGSINLSTQGTGFVVDAEAGLILTNRHILGAGPSVIHAIFPNGEEVDLAAVYRDPVHDFAFLRYDPSLLKSISPYEFPLVAKGAAVGREVRVIGNDAGERLSILGSTIARLDRNVPEYGPWRYNDFNTFYIQAASGTSPGSSGSPVIDLTGNAVALASGSRVQTMSGYFLPLERVQRALQLVLRGERVARGSLQTSFEYESFAELRRLGLSESARERAEAHAPDGRGLLVVKGVISGSPADALLQVGDVLIEVADSLITDFEDLAEVLDESVGQLVRVSVERAGVAREAEIPVSDLHEITPREYVTIGGTILHPLSYQQARHYGRPITGIYVAEDEYMLKAGGVNAFGIIFEIDGNPTNTLDELESALEAIGSGAAANVRWIDRSDPGRERVSLVRFNRHWAAAKRCAEQDGSGVWSCRDLAVPAAAGIPEPRRLNFRDWGTLEHNRIARSLVRVDVDIPFDGINGEWENRLRGTGLIVDATRGWVVTSRDVVPHAVADVRITFDDSLEVAGRVEYIHPVHNLAVLAYDPSALKSADVRSAMLGSKSFAPGESTHFAGLRSNGSLVYRPTLVEAVTAVSFSGADQTGFRDFNLDVISLVDAPPSIGGVLLDQAQEEVLALWAPLSGYRDGPYRGIASEVVTDMLERLRSGDDLRSLEVQWVTQSLSKARLLSLPDHWIEAYEHHDPVRRRLLRASRILGGAPAAEVVREGDVLLAIDGNLAGSFREVERLSQRERVQLTLLRDGEVIEVTAETLPFDGQGVSQVVQWAGAILVAPFRALSFNQGIEPIGVFSTIIYWGSPASGEALAHRRIVALNDLPTPDLKSFVEVARSLQGRAPVRVKTLDHMDRPSVQTIRLEPNYWPLEVLRRTEDGWVLEEYP